MWISSTKSQSWEIRRSLHHILPMINSCKSIKRSPFIKDICVLLLTKNSNLWFLQVSNSYDPILPSLIHSLIHLCHKIYWFRYYLSITSSMHASELFASNDSNCGKTFELKNELKQLGNIYRICLSGRENNLKNRYWSL